MDWAHVLVIVQCQTDGCSLSCKDGATVWQSFGQLAAGCLTILEMVVDDRRYPHSLVHFGAISVDFIMISLRFVILSELSLGFLSGNHAFAYSFNEVVSPGIVIVRSWWKVGCPQGGRPIRHWSLQRSWLSSPTHMCVIRLQWVIIIRRAFSSAKHYLVLTLQCMGCLDEIKVENWAKTTIAHLFIHRNIPLFHIVVIHYTQTHTWSYIFINTFLFLNQMYYLVILKLLPNPGPFLKNYWNIIKK